MKDYQPVVKNLIFGNNCHYGIKTFEEEKMKTFLVTMLLLLVFGLPFCAAQEGDDRSGIFVDIGLGMNYSPVDQKAFLSPLIGLEVSMVEKVMVDVGFSFESDSFDFSGIAKTVNRYFSVHLLGKYFLLGGLWAGGGFAYSMFLNSYTVNAVPSTPGVVHPDRIKFLLASGYLSKVLEGIYLNPALLIRMVLPSEEADSFDLNLGMFITASLNIRRD